MVPGGPLDHQMLCFPMNLKGSVPRVPDANPVQLFKSLLGQAFQHLEDPWRVPGRSLEVPEGPWGIPGGPWRIPGASLEAPWESQRFPGVPGRYLEGAWRAPGEPLDHQMHCFPRNLKGSVPGVPDANPVQLFKSSLGLAFQHLEDPWRVPGGSLGVPEGP
jgi:hypothetical protein